ncbi:hypothetical protein FSP39_012843, partial [Pinctada imbricata]
EVIEKLNTVNKEKQALAEFNKKTNSQFQYLKPKQIQCLRESARCDNIVLVLPTGYGKSLIFELLPYYMRHVHGYKKLVIIIVEPLNTIIEQELEKVGEDGIHLTNEMESQSHYLYYIGHPEEIMENIQKIPKNMDVTWVVVDESHCILEWGEDFRPQYKLLGELRAHLADANVRMLACTATASKESQKAIANYLGMTECHFINTVPVLNDNIMLSVQQRIPSVGGLKNSVIEAYNFVYKPLILELFQKKDQFPLTIVYCKLQWCAYGVQLCNRLLGPEFLREIPLVVQYHSQQPKQVNQQINLIMIKQLQVNQEIISYLSEEPSPVRLVFATIALGMGCDLKKVSRIIHAGVPSSLETYVQEIGRAGRTGAQSNATIFYNATDLAGRHVSKKSRQLLIDLLHQYKDSDNTGECKSHLTDHIIMLIGETCEFVNSMSTLEEIFNLPTVISQAIMEMRENTLKP